MSSVIEHLSKLREDRIAREKARIEKLREINLKKYNKNEPQQNQKPFISSSIVPNKSSKSEPFDSNARNTSTLVKNHIHVNGTAKRSISAPITNNRQSILNKDGIKPKTQVNIIKSEVRVVNNVKHMPQVKKIDPKVTTSTEKSHKIIANSTKIGDINMTVGNKSKLVPKNDVKTFRKSIAPKPMPLQPINTKPKPAQSFKKSMLPLKITEIDTKVNPKRQSVFERLYQPKITAKKPVTDIQKLQTDATYLKKVIKDSGLIMKRRQTVFEPKGTVNPPVRRSISAVHFKRISKQELSNCIHKWSSIGEKLDKVHLKEINEDDSIKQDKVISAIKSERKKVKFQTPVPFNFNTPKPEELQARLQNWLKKRGKTLDSYHHLQCFGIHHLPQREIKPLNLEQPLEFDDEDKENVPLESDSDNESFTDNMNDRKNDFDNGIVNENILRPLDVDERWRTASFVSDSVDLNETQNSTLTSAEMINHVDDLLVGALNDLTELLREGLDWEQGARWLRAIRDRYPTAPDSAPYWECRAALEERRGDLTASVQCWEEAIAKGTERSVVEANLDQLLDKFMQLKISPSSGKRQQPDPKMVDIKNVFKSTLIRFAVQQAKLRQSNHSDPRTPAYTVTPVRRSGRLGVAPRTTPRALRTCESVRSMPSAMFVRNPALVGTP